MSVFVVIAPSENEALTSAIAQHFPEKSYTIAPGQFLVAGDKLTGALVAQRLGAPSGAVGKIMVVQVTGYAGWHDRGIWEWLAVQGVPPIPGSLMNPTPKPETPLATSDGGRDG